jgi:hypothetical protein
MDNSHTTHAHAQRFLVPALTLIARTVAVVSGCSPQHSGQEAAGLTHASGNPADNSIVLPHLRKGIDQHAQ